jgi:hypothetical protein
VQQARALNLIQAMVEHIPFVSYSQARWIPTRELPRWECFELDVDCCSKAFPYFVLASRICCPVD